MMSGLVLFYRFIKIPHKGNNLYASSLLILDFNVTIVNPPD